MKHNACSTHCCKIHGCKYRFEDCPVYLGVEKQEYLCEDCYIDCNEYFSQNAAEGYKKLKYFATEFLKSKAPEYDDYGFQFTKFDLLTDKIVASFKINMGISTATFSYETLDKWVKENWKELNI